MSKIAQALAKATESTGHTTAPFLTGLPPVEPPGRASKEAELRKARLRWRFWRWLAFIAFPLTAFILWAQFGVGRRPTASGANLQTESKAATAVTEKPVGQVGGGASGASAQSAMETGGEPSAGPKSRVEMEAQVQALVFTALMPGSKPRIVHQGRVIGIGDHVGEEFVFSGIEDGLLVFKDSAGAVYTRRY